SFVSWEDRADRARSRSEAALRPTRAPGEMARVGGHRPPGPSKGFDPLGRPGAGPPQRGDGVGTDKGSPEGLRRAPGPLDEQDANRPPLAGERQARLLSQVPKDRALVMIFAPRLLGGWVSLVVRPGELSLRWRFDLADDRSPDPFADPLEEHREI